MENCSTEQSTDENKESYVLPSWRVNQIILAAVKFLTDIRFYSEGFDYKKAISDKGIVIKGYSDFEEQHLAELQKVSLSLWKEGLCLVFPNKETGETCRMIAYNDKKSDVEVMQIIFHEYGHIEFKHTVQSQNGEAEAIVFSAVATLLVVAEKMFHFGRLNAAQNGEGAFYEGMREGLKKGLNEKEVA